MHNVSTRTPYPYALAAALLAVACSDDGDGFTSGGPIGGSYGPTGASAATSPNTNTNTSPPMTTEAMTDTDAVTDTDGTSMGSGPTTNDPTTGDPTTGTSAPTTETTETTSPPPPECGDGKLDPGEECDDGNNTNSDACTNACTIAFCGDGIVGPGEGCDDGNGVNNDSCTNECTAAGCGDGVVGPGEACDDGNGSNTDACTNACKAAACGDGFVQAGVEACDDGNKTNGDGCSSSCQNEGQKYNAVGPQVNVPAASLTGWTVCYTDKFGDFGTPVSTILAQCTKANLMLACRPTGSTTYGLLAHAPRASVIADTGQSNIPTNANGSGWYFSDSWSWGFAKQGDTITRNSCDVENGNANLRLCFHTDGGVTQEGYRCGATVGIFDTTYERVVLQAD